ncbi:hypothetical protein COV20_02005 [Candidatus Woesearchaeota archaeon CG10_big_fil_rev_8_21_14_0_10_45_16]|nr:MAG: hypothetical protein COV20_02005 [Candidatus Woesearchaeota archaeon CG10_big_fil_rev_8_21_14_0_10_45_16]
MLLQQIKLQNIRSYEEETIVFPEGTTLLAGDIGSGKSSILLAIEFALFGTSRPDLPGELLLRKGANQGSVELTAAINGQVFTIKRNLKKDKDTIKQLPGYIIKGNVKKDLTAVELKTEVVSLLGYPQDVISKNKNYIFRYTVYTPQEEMKLILQENPEIRLDVLRKIFNVDKYKNIRENIQHYLKKMRTDIAILKTRLEPLEGLQAQQKTIQENIQLMEKALRELKPGYEMLLKKHLSLEKQLEMLEQNQRQLQEWQKEIKTLNAVIEEKNRQLAESREKIVEIKAKVDSFTLKTEVTEIKKEIKELEERQENEIRIKTNLEQKVTQIQETIAQQQKEIKGSAENTAGIPEKEKLQEQLEQEIAEKERLQEKSVQLQELFERTSELVSRNKILLEQSQQVQEKMKNLEECPTCLQEVSSGHKEKIISEETKKVKQAENLLFELQKKVSQIQQQREEVAKKREELFRKENLLTRTKLELLHLREEQRKMQEKRENLLTLSQDNNKTMEELQKWQMSSPLGQLKQTIEEKQEILKQHHSKTLLEQQQEEHSKRIGRLEEEIAEKQGKKDEYQRCLVKVEDVSSKIDLLKKDLAAVREEEKKAAVIIAEQENELKNASARDEEISKNVQQLLENQKMLIRKKELYHWLDGHLLKLTYAIEKQVMVTIHSRFNEMFQEWFSTLIDDDDLYARIDDTFSPVIEQNGYETSFANLSGGEKTSASLAYRLALNRVINDVIHLINTKEVLILDEPTDGFSSEQLDKVRDVLDKLNLKQTIIVSHENKIESFVENVVRIQKQGHRSSIN